MSNPLYVRQKDGSYIGLNDLDTLHPSLDKFDMFPIERTYSEWANSQFAAGGVQMNGRFGGAHPTGVMETCQDCHMPEQDAPGCRVPGFEAGHPDMPSHFLNGGNNWVIRSVRDLYTDGDGGLNDPVFMDEFTGLTEDIVNESIARAEMMLELSSDMELTQDGNLLTVRVINFCGHKLPSGYPEGRRIWINVQFLDDDQQVVLEHGAYDFDTAELTTDDTKVYEAKLGLDAHAAGETGLPEGESFHFILNNTILFDNRIPPVGFTNSAFEAVQAEPVGYSYADGQYWDDTVYGVPPQATRAEVQVYFQLTSKEYIEFLRDENTTDNRGLIAYNEWVAKGKSPPVKMEMDGEGIDLGVPGDLNNDGRVGIADLLILFAEWGPCPEPCPPTCRGDITADCTVGIGDLLLMFANWG